MYYIAGPFFKPEALEAIKDIEDLLDEMGHTYFSPREYGVIANESMNPERMTRIFQMNIRMVHECEDMIAVTDDFDPGTMFEIGAFYTKRRLESCFEEPEDSKLITYSPKEYGCNVMIARAVFTHARDRGQLMNAINGHQVEEEWEVTE